MTMVRHDSSNNQPLSTSTSSIPVALMDGTTKRRRRQLSLPKGSLSRFFSTTKNTNTHQKSAATTMADVDESSALQLPQLTTKKHETQQVLSLTQQQLQDDLELVKQQQMLSMKEDKQLLSSFVKRRIRQASMPMSSTLSRFFDTTATATATATTRGEESDTTRKDNNNNTGTDTDNTLGAVAAAAAAAPKECVTTRVPNKKKGQQQPLASQHTVQFSTHDDHDDPMVVGEPHCVFYEPRPSYECPTHMSTLWYTQWNLNQVAAERTHTVEIMCPNGVEPLPDNPLYCLRGLEIQYSKALAEQRYFQRQFFKAVVFNEQARQQQQALEAEFGDPITPATVTSAVVVVDNNTTTTTITDDDDDDDDAASDLPAQIYQQAQAYSGTALQQAQQRAVQDAHDAALYQREVVVVAARPGKVWWKTSKKKHSKKR